ncbi:MAG: RNase adapter RapZ [Deltaproteobacteria bacterium]|nr:MAG: RNase adapter RapZ [Deltaproteobacteria bacterium]
MTPSQEPDRSVDIIVVTGTSGSGKSTAINALEDAGYYCIDNLPTALVERFVELCASASEGMERVSLGLDLRDVAYVERWPKLRRALEEAGHRVQTVFLDASDEVLLRRFSETRRAHPLGQGRDLPEAIAVEREALAPLKEMAETVIDTSDLTVHDLKRRMQELATERGAAVRQTITVKSFGYKFGVAGDADLVLDVRFLPNPHFVPELRPLSGLDRPVADFVLDRDDTREFLDHMDRLLEFLLPRYRAEGRSYLTIAVGCTGGRHRSVVLTEAIAARLRRRGVSVIVRHRDIDRGI